MRISISRLFIPMMFAAIIGAFLLPVSAQAQCGTSASSCQSCHEVQAQEPVNTEGDWHIDHSFGDFCEFCHAGNVTATDPQLAHTAMIYPLSDPQGSCSSCHATNYTELSLQYASTLGIELESVSQPPAEPADEDSEPAPTSEVPATEEAAVNGQIIDFNNRYDDFASENAAPTPINTGNVILSVMLIGLVGTFGALAWKFEGLDKHWAQLRGKMYPATGNPVTHTTGSPTLAALIPALEKANPATLVALTHLLEADPAHGGDMIEAVARLDPRLVTAVRRLSDHDLGLLVALVRELNERSS